jgi:acetylornithine deacetylase/succinyl-diaminopimelate desuccinylase-like protein
MTEETLSLESLQTWYEDHHQEIRNDFLSFLRFKSISTDPSYSQDIRATAQWLSNLLEKWGFDVEIWETSNHPCIFASHLKAGADAPTVLFYNHYDVQPVDPLHLWKSDPFEPVIIGDNVFARGASDNKGQCFYTINALRAVLELAKKSKVNIKLLIEGEEEVGSKGTEELLPKKKEALKADYAFVVDGGIPSETTPAVTLGMRGLVALEVEFVTAAIDLHSGIHGGLAFNANHALVQTLSKLWDKSGKIAVPGFYDGIEPFTEEEKKYIALLFDKEAYQKEFGVKAFANEPGFTLPQSAYIRPTLDINGISGGYGGEGFKTVIPARASAKISCRIVPNQDPDDVAQKVKKYILDNVPEGVEAKITIFQGGPAFRTSYEDPIVKIAKVAYEEVFGVPCCIHLCGASVPIVPALARVSEAQTLLFGVALDKDNFHAPNEHFGLKRLKQGFLTIGRILASCSSFP